MSSNFGHPSQPVFMVDSGRGQPRQHQYYHQQMPRHTEPRLVPCWTFPPAQAEMRKRDSGRMNAGMAWVLTLLLLLVFAALGVGAYQILMLQTEVQRLSQWQEKPAQMQSNAPLKQVGLNPAELNRNTQKSAAHLIGRPDQSTSSGTLKWEAKLGEAFTEGVKYINGSLQVNETGLYFVYSRVEILSPKCNPKDYYTHKVGLKRNSRDRTIMEDHREGLCVVGSNQPWMTGSQLGSLQHLRESDWLFVSVSHPHLLSKNYHSNYFGLFKIH
ncbi:Tumor necrosis factor ligand superfamily member 6 [Labeo rohita]|uniref:Tumor necrosis factor ligand superfamily member 6 n=1 Tax=Labeo rohita TaxID=84645 RepID=A0ABQ8LME1_LABRO|nr:tumor necrosis factor ligand superfamily member 6 [Labeo rohita]KAI2651827.1 Tumor necrosis factor ligand superfamily member 6 [Labeo rohita]